MDFYNTDYAPATRRGPHHGENVKRFRGLRGIKQEVLADMLGKSGSWIYEMERKAVIDDESLQLIADALQIHIDVLKNYTDNCDVQINTFDNENVKSSGYFEENNNIENDIKEITAALQPLYDKINEKNLEIYKLKEEVKSLKAKK